MMSMKLSDISNLSIKSSYYCCIISGSSRNEAINLMRNANLTEKSGTLENIKNLLSYVKMGKEILTFGDTEFEKKHFLEQ